MSSDIRLNESDVTKDTVSAIEEDLGMGHGAWDTIRPERIIAAIINHFLRRGQELEQEGAA